MLYVDTHPHILAPDTQKYPVAPLAGKQSEWSKGYQNSAEQLLEHMDQAGVQLATLVQASTYHGYDNSYVADAVARYPNRFAGVACVDPQVSDAPDTLSYWINERKLIGVRLFTAGSTMRDADTSWFVDRALDPFWQRAHELDIPVVMQARFRDLHLLRTVMDRNPRTRFIVDHMAHAPTEDGPPYAAARDLLELARYPQLALKFSRANFDEAQKGASTVQAFFRTVIDAFGAERLMWGSNYPAVRGQSATPYKDLVDYAREQLAPFSTAEQEWLFGRAAVAAYRPLAKIAS